VDKDREIRRISAKLQRLMRSFSYHPDAASHFENSLRLVEAAQFLAASNSLERLDDIDIVLESNDRVEILECISTLRLLDPDIYQQTLELQESLGISNPEEIHNVFLNASDSIESPRFMFVARSLVIISGLVFLGFSIWLFVEIPAQNISKLFWYPLASIVLVGGILAVYLGLFGNAKSVMHAINSIFR